MAPPDKAISVQRLPARRSWPEANSSGLPTLSTFENLIVGDSRTFRLTSLWRVDGEVTEALEILHDMESIVDWWPAAFMRIEVIDSGGPEAVGKTVRLHTKGLLPHTFQFLARLIASDRPDTVTIEIRGDFFGQAHIACYKLEDCLGLSFDWSVRVNHPWIGQIVPVFRSIFAWNHRWVMHHGRAGLQREMYRRRRLPTNRLEPVRLAPTFPHNFRFVRNLYRWRCPAVWID